MKTCSLCRITKELSEFGIKKSENDGLQCQCKPCANLSAKALRKTKIGVVSTIYGTQKANSKKRGHTPPEYTLDELREWVFNQDLFHELYNEWKTNNYQRRIKPSIDRIKDEKGYSFSNIQLMTVEENEHKSHYDRRNGYSMSGKRCRAVKMYDSQMILIREFYSIAEASRQTNIQHSDISSCCAKRLKTSGGYIWEYKTTK